MKKFKISITNLKATEPNATIGMLCDSLEEAQMAYEVIKSQNFTEPVCLTLHGDNGELIQEDNTAPPLQ